MLEMNSENTGHYLLNSFLSSLLWGSFSLPKIWWYMSSVDCTFCLWEIIYSTKTASKMSLAASVTLMLSVHNFMLIVQGLSSLAFLCLFVINFFIVFCTQSNQAISENISEQ